MATELYARARLERLVAYTTPPTLDPDEITDLLSSFALTDAAGAAWAGETEWAVETAYALGDVAVPTQRTGVRFVVTVAGTSAATEPAWPATGTVVDGTVTWGIDAALPAAWAPSYALAGAASEGWRMKAGLVSDRFRFADDGDQYDRQQIFEHCLKMAELYGKKALAGELIVGSAAGGVSGAGMLTLEPSTRRLGLDEDRMIRLRTWDGNGDLPAVNSPYYELP